MKRSPGCVLCSALLLGSSLALSALPANAQNSGGYLGEYRCNGVVTIVNGRRSCVPAGGANAGTASHRYGQWDDGTAALGSGSSGTDSLPFYFRGFSSVHDFGR